MKDNFADRAADWDSPEKTKMTEIFVAEMKRLVNFNPKWKALEVGAGTGLVGLQVVDMLESIVFEDTSEAMLDVLKQKTKNMSNFEIVHGEIFDYQQQDIDFVFSCMAFHHIPEIEKALSHLSLITKKGATIVIGDIRSEDGSFHRFEPIPHKGFDTEILSKQFQKAGFKVVSEHTYNKLSRERTAGIFTDYEQFMLVAEKS